MTNHIATYFYHDIEDMGASYGNIFLPLNERNSVYWQTVYTLFFSLKIFNKSENITLDLFTNIQDFPYRKEIEALGVKIYDNLTLTSRNHGKWATVKFFFDVLDFIVDNENFKSEDGILLLDTDVIATQSTQILFNFLHEGDHPVAYVLDQKFHKTHTFHGLDIFALENIGAKIFARPPEIKSLIGGEFFLFRKNTIGASQRLFSALRKSNYSKSLSTEEQILTIVHGLYPWRNYPHAIHRVWTSIMHFDLPKHSQANIFLHLPSEKEDALDKLFNLTKDMDPHNLNEADFRLLLKNCIRLDSPISLYISKIANKIKGYLK
jgi:hypothetical protein